MREPDIDAHYALTREEWKAILLPFFAGAVIESACVLWVHFSERNLASYTSLCSMAIAVANVNGIGEALLSKHKRLAKVSWVLGFGFGTYVTVYLKAKGWTF